MIKLFTDTKDKPLVIFEMANNHMGDIEHGLEIIEQYAKFQEKYGSHVKFAFKFQYRDLDSFIHPDFVGSDLKYVKRFEETRLGEAEWQSLIAKVKSKGMVAICTPFDEASVDKVVKDGFDVIKIASCSFTDWPLLEQIAKQDKPIIASVGGSSDDDISNVVAFLTHREKQFALLYCVGMYPTLSEDLNVSMVSELCQRYPELTIGFSTHEEPGEANAVAVAYGAGARIFEKHVALATNEYGKNQYSTDWNETDLWLSSLVKAINIYGSIQGRIENLERENTNLMPIKRGVFARHQLAKGEQIKFEDVYFAIPAQEGGLVANDFSKFKTFTARHDIAKDGAVLQSEVEVQDERRKIMEIRNKVRCLIAKSGIIVPKNVKLEISHHYGLQKFEDYGLCMLTILNNAYCKKYLFCFAGQKHPEQYHKVKHETFIVVYGSVRLILDGEVREMSVGDVASIAPGVKHEFYSLDGAVVEELSTESMQNDSFYTDDAINLTIKRKSFIELI